MAAIPPFTHDGVLPPGDWEASLDELRRSILVTGPEGEIPTWDAGWRRQLVDNLEILARQLWSHLPGLIAGRDHRGHALEFPSFFRTSRRPLASGDEKGIVALRRTS